MFALRVVRGCVVTGERQAVGRAWCDWLDREEARSDRAPDWYGREARAAERADRADRAEVGRFVREYFERCMAVRALDDERLADALTDARERGEL